ncbi:alanine or glycine:cation symporter, AGCS family [Alkalithermobacter thermoalcaliphilus JW-YL-7 = DSM 7308]|uniref:Alanine or glycine:cation symporter, AGCS family n=1 Tax=Alkalithermobacter thermoalcaliphilus JW-YL-7 = DSM 7308 TaxID=1121328 RepID=A0A150FNR3_CLOPD|nr:amino acid carrier protein [[Clostridium] paradoxum JW-YL-7 = DSM 7308]SHK85627.1 alanine or glycine:cation symporter, AGCS family [[Clostridium] paradoxum JW-YL-7 = DSM 7308]
MDLFTIVNKINSILWGPIMLFMLLGTGVLFTLKLRFLQIRKLKYAFKLTFDGILSKSDRANEDGMSSFQALSTAIAAQVGTGNLAGVATAIAAGGPGAIFWMWISGFFGMSTIFAEAILAQVYKKRVDGEITGGPAYYITDGLKNKYLAAFFSIAIILALGFMGNMVQSNSVGAAISGAFNINPLFVGIGVAIIVGLIIIGGIGRIASFTEKVVPFMAIFYILGSLIIIFLNYEHIIPAFKMIIYGAFNPMAATGGLIGATIKESFRYGIARGLFSNEAGMGSTPHAHAVAKVKHPGQQGLVALMGVVIDTGIVCTLTALVILTTGSIEAGLSGAALTQEGFIRGFGGFGSYFVAICLFFFSLSTIIGWYFFGESNVKFLFGKKGLVLYKIIVLLCIIVGATMKVELVWEIADTFNALMVIPNLIALLGMTSLIVKVANDFENNFEKGKLSEYTNKDNKLENPQH